MTLLLGLVVLPFAAVPVQAQPESQPQSRTTAYVSDMVEVPLRAGASNRYKIVGAVRSGSAVTVLKADAVKGYTQIRASSGARGWISSDQLTETPSSREQLLEVRQELGQLEARHADLQQHVDGAAGRPDSEQLSYSQLYEEALRLRQQLAQYRKVASDTVAIDERNKALQERTVTLERELQIIQQENQALRNDNGTVRFLMGAVLLGAVLLVALLMPKIREQRRVQWSQL
ncbi:MAG: TIGR04211 family SH3 domain-containing protein [Candidatus Competibacteraceae bacterium]|nr:TIGR04211 family SH3 domain-containing protein [Candidatus Competibacteraceae bacterium]MBK7984340.1 TIGR04211 family SH3 domain-containing protein [Candidatus Competibacteraceae bacterium]MBK8896307.1 TIGR04211 family SH3 domain-containing protein [Candidatus Competibacteraceae bacterium]MBK8964883.1 TIGR04211 family SH3 domain-containing protein [Candidatus Competibacteraceae bacterium]MBK9950164.1 TIGR04211 family SH3 domain-containing protein [Candidatus Competibacteraceae bacterium]